MADSSTRPTIILPAWKDHQAAATGFWPHLKTMAERARAGIATAPLSPSADAAEDMAEGSAAPTVPVYPTVTPSAKRSLKRQSSKALDTAAAPADKAATKSKTNPPKLFQDSDMVLYTHIGLAPPLAGETASHQQERMIQNEVKLVAYITSLERVTSAVRTDTSTRNTEFARMLADTQAALRSMDVGHNAGTNVTPLKLELAMVQADLNTSITEFANRLSDLAANNNALPKVRALKVEVAELRADMLAADNHRIRAGSPFSLERDPAFQALTREVAALRLREDKQRMEDIVNTLPPPEFYDAITAMRADISLLYSKAAEAGRISTAMAPSSASAAHGPTRPLTAAIPSLFMSAPLAPPSHVARLPTIATTPSNVFLPAVIGNTGSTTGAPFPMFHTASTVVVSNGLWVG
ncbi:hypothetical protein B0H14DRAFT_3457693 [Mycena olivaceomarginata]|nr:hypothetical protein B0H14DRAFT_3457693 [Mycena olivaceomarginata]